MPAGIEFQMADGQLTAKRTAETKELRALHGLARALASHNKLDEAMDAAQAALKESPRDPELHHTRHEEDSPTAWIRRDRP